MKTENKLKILKIIRIALLIIFIPSLLFYLGIVLPEYLACCDEHKNETNIGVDFWGNQVDCIGESKEFGEFFFNVSTMFIVVFSITLAVAFYLVHHLKKKLK